MTLDFTGVTGICFLISLKHLPLLLYTAQPTPLGSPSTALQTLAQILGQSPLLVRLGTDLI